MGLHKTFIDKNLKSKAQDKIEEDLLNSLQTSIEEELNKEEFNKESYNHLADIITGIKNPISNL